MKTMKTLLAFLLLLGSAVAQNQYYVSPSGSDSNSGTISQPWRTIQHADSALQLGTPASSNCGQNYGAWIGDTNVAVCVHVAPGTYTGNEIVTTHAGNSTQKVVWISTTKWGAVIQNNQSGTCCAWVVHGDFVEVVGFDVSNIMPANNCVTNAACDGVAAIIIAGNNQKYFSNNVHNGHGNFAENTCNANGGGGIESAGGTVWDRVSLIGNSIHNIGTSGTGAGFCHFIHNPYVSLSNGIIAYNIVGAGPDGIGCTHCSGMLVANNTVFNEGGQGLDCSSGGTGTQCIGSSTQQFGRCVAFSSATGTNTIANNLCANNSAAGSIYAPIVTYNGTGLAGLVSHNLEYYVASGNGAGSKQTAAIDIGGGTATVTGNLLSNTIGVSDPKFVNYAANGTGDYHLSAGSAAIGAGVNVTGLPPVDFDGTPQTNPPSIGALGLSGAAVLPPAAPTGLTAIVQ